MRILTYNIHGWTTIDGRPNLDAVAQVIAETGADIVGLNEVYYPRTMDGAAEPALAALAARLDMHFSFGPCLRWPAQGQMPADAFGNALLSRWPIIAGAAHHLTSIEGKEQRGLLEGRILLPNEQPFTVYVTHLDYADEETRLVQLRALRTWTIRDRNRPHVVVGDFNAVSSWDFQDCEALLHDLSHHPKGSSLGGGEQGPRVVAQMEKAGYCDLYRQFGARGRQTYIPATDPPIRIDYIFASRPLKVQARMCQIWQEAPGTEASDHRPVLAEFDPEQAPPADCEM